VRPVKVGRGDDSGMTALSAFASAKSVAAGRYGLDLFCSALTG
jgi:hypothetical protein